MSVIKYKKTVADHGINIWNEKHLLPKVLRIGEDKNNIFCWYKI